MGKDNQNQLAFLMEKLYLIDKQLGGTAKKLTEAKGSQGEFESIHNECKQIMFSIKKKIEEIEGSKNRDKAVIVQEQEIRDQLHQCQELIKSMNEVLTNQAKKPKTFDRNDVQRRDKLYNLVKQELQILMERRGLQQDSGDALNPAQINVLTLTEMKKNLMNNGGQKQIYRAEANDIEIQALEDFRKKDEQMDAVLDRINDNADVLRGKANEMGDKIDQVGSKVKTLNNKVEEANKQLDTSNKRMKDVLLKYRAPNKFCLDMILIFFLLGLIGIGYTMIK